MLRSRRAGVRVVGIVLLLVLACAPAHAQRATSRVAEPAVPEKAGKELVAHYVGDTPPRIDGDLDDEIWQQAQAIDDMVQNDPNNMEAPTERTVRSEEHTSELQSPCNLVCRLLLEKKKKQQ